MVNSMVTLALVVRYSDPPTLSLDFVTHRADPVRAGILAGFGRSPLRSAVSSHPSLSGFR